MRCELTRPIPLEIFPRMGPFELWQPSVVCVSEETIRCCCSCIMVMLWIVMGPTFTGGCWTYWTCLPPTMARGTAAEAAATNPGTEEVEKEVFLISIFSSF